jgi:PAS domain S-box-containing protein
MRFSPDQLRSFINAIPTATWSCFLDGPADFFNQCWLGYTGLALEQALELGWKGAIHPYDLPRILEKFEGAVRSEQPFEVEARIRRSDCVFRWFLVRGNPLQDGSGRVVRWCGTNTDIEDRKRTEEGLRASERTLRLVKDQ